MEQPCPCTHCGEWFDLEDGYGSDKWYPNTVICEDCHQKEELEIETDEEERNCDNNLSDAVYTINESLEELRKMGRSKAVYVVKYVYQNASVNSNHKKVLEYLNRLNGDLVYDLDYFLKRVNTDIAEQSKTNKSGDSISLYRLDQNNVPVFYESFGNDRSATPPVLKLLALGG